MPPGPPTYYALKRDFRYFHEPVPEELSPAWVVGRTRLAQELADRIMLSRGGAFLISGLRGVGKTTFVRFAIHLIRAGRQRFLPLAGHYELVDVWINLARPLEPVQLLHHLIRHLYLRLKETGLLERLDSELRKDLRTAFLRTSFEISSRSLVAEERGRGAEFGTGKAPWLGLEFLGKVSSTYKRSQSDEEALKYLPYDEKAAEFDVVSFSRRLAGGLSTDGSRWRRWLDRWLRRAQSLPRVKVVFVLDELDKLELADGKAAKSPLDPVLQAFKSVFTASGFAFVFIGGKEVQARLLEDVSHGDSLYESIFAYDLYLPCLWDQQDELVGRCFEGHGASAGRTDTLALYLRYKGRGIPRLTWRELNKYVLWEDQGPVLALDLERRRYMQVFAKLQEALENEEAYRLALDSLEQVQVDRQRLCFYYLMDWIFRRGRELFSRKQLAGEIASLNLGSERESAPPDRVAKSVIQMLVNRAFIERGDQERAQIGQGEGDDLYRVTAWVLLAFRGSSDKQWIPEEGAVNQPFAAQVEFERIGRYHVVQKIDEGGFGVVYKVSDLQGRRLAAKVLHAQLAASPDALVHFQREIQVLRELDHPGVVRLHDAGEEQGRPFFVMDFLEGASLRKILANLKTIRPDQAVVLGRELASIYSYIHSCGFVRLDIKPSNMFLTDDVQIKVLDFGIARFAEPRSDRRSTRSHLVIGTPAYMAPEQAREQKIDARADIFSLGVVLYEMLTGQTPFGADSAVNEILKVINDDPPPLSQFAEISPELGSVVLKALAKDPSRRFQSMQELGEALEVFAPSADLDQVIQDLRRLDIGVLQPPGQSTVVLQAATAVTRFPPDTAAARPRAETPVTVGAAAPEAVRGAGGFGWLRWPWRFGSKRTTPPQPQPLPPPPPPPRTAGVPARPAGPSSPVIPVPPPQPLARGVPPQAAMLAALVNSPEADPPSLVAAIGEVDASGATEAIPELIKLARHQDPVVQRTAFTALSRLSALQAGSLQLLFDLTRRLCLWGGLGTSISTVVLDTAKHLTLGRDARDVDLALPDPSLSRQHAAFFAGEDKVEVEDLSSANGTLLNGKRFRREALADGDVLRMGDREITVYVVRRENSPG